MVPAVGVATIVMVMVAVVLGVTVWLLAIATGLLVSPTGCRNTSTPAVSESTGIPTSIVVPGMDPETDSEAGKTGTPVNSALPSLFVKGRLARTTAGVVAGTAVVVSFLEAAAISVILISLLLIVLMRSIREVFLVFAPLTLAALFTVAATVVLDLPFNFANVIVLPLLFGLGVASAIHLIMRERDEAGFENVLQTTTPRAVLFSALTTIGSFGSIALSSHPGTSSMGTLLTIAIAFTLVSSLIVVPTLMFLWPRSGSARE